MSSLMSDVDNKEVIDELSEVMYILVTRSAENLKEHEEWGNIVETITQVSKMSVKTKKGLSNKTIFKHMDIIDELE
jgi:hypothetical protein